jgi:hypothetical protein
VVFSDDLAIALPEIIRNASEMPIVRRISIGVVSFLLRIPSLWGTTVGAHANVLDGSGMQIGVVPDCCRRIRVGQGGTSQAKQGKNPMSTSTALSSPSSDSAD